MQKQIPHDYKVGEKVLYRADPSSKFGADAYEGRYKVVKVNDNGTVRDKIYAGMGQTRVEYD